MTNENVKAMLMNILFCGTTKLFAYRLNSQSAKIRRCMLMDQTGLKKMICKKINQKRAVDVKYLFYLKNRSIKFVHRLRDKYICGKYPT